MPKGRRSRSYVRRLCIPEASDFNNINPFRQQLTQQKFPVPGKKYRRFARQGLFPRQRRHQRPQLPDPRILVWRVYHLLGEKLKRVYKLEWLWLAVEGLRFPLRI